MKGDTIRDEDDIEAMEDNALPEVLRVPQPVPGYIFHARAPQETDIDLITNDEWEIEVLNGQDATIPYRYLGQTTIDDARVNVWHISETEGFIAQKLTDTATLPVRTDRSISLGVGDKLYMGAYGWVTILAFDPSKYTIDVQGDQDGHLRFLYRKA